MTRPMNGFKRVQVPGDSAGAGRGLADPAHLGNKVVERESTAGLSSQSACAKTARTIPTSISVSARRSTPRPHHRTTRIEPPPQPAATPLPAYHDRLQHQIQRLETVSRSPDKLRLPAPTSRTPSHRGKPEQWREFRPVLITVVVVVITTKITMRITTLPAPTSAPAAML